MLSPGKVHYEIGSNTDAMIYGGIGAVHRLVVKLGLAEKIDESLKLLKVHLPYHESDHVLNIAYNVLCGGTRLEDIERLRHSTAYMKRAGCGADPGSDDGRGLLPALPGRRRDPADGIDQRGAAAAVARPGA